MTLPARLRSPAALAGWLVAVTVLAYIPALGAGFVWDDDLHVTANRNVQSPDGLPGIWTGDTDFPHYYPVTLTSFWIESRLWGKDPRGFHAVNVLLHAAGAILVFRILGRLGVPGAWLAAAIFALHPVHVESAAWIAERKNVLSGVLYLAAAGVYLTWSLRDGDDASSPRPRSAPERAAGASGAGLPIAAIALFVAALLAKSVTASLPVALALVLWWRRGRIERKDLPWLGAMLAIGAAAGVATVLMERQDVGATGREFAMTFPERILVAGRAFWFYLGKLAWPYPLSFSYPKWPIDVASPAAWAFPAAAGAATVALWTLRRRIGRAPFTALAFFGVTVSPALGFLNVYPFRFSWVADHFQYLASIGPIALAAAGAVQLAGRRGGAAAWRPAAALLLAGLGALSWRQARAYENLETLWRATIAVSADSFLAQYNLGYILHQRGEIDAALTHYAQALRTKPDYYEPLVNSANILADRGRTAEAIGYYERALAIAPDHPLAHYNLGLAYEETGRLDAAERAYREAIRQDPGMSAARNNLAIVRFRARDFAGAWNEVREMRRRGAQPHPDFVRALAQAMPDPGAR